MKAKDLALALDLIKGPASSSERDLVEVSPSGMRTGDDVWWARTELVKVDFIAILPCKKLVEVVKSIPEEEEVELELRSSRCVVTTPDAVFKLNVREAMIPEMPKLQNGSPVTSSGYELAEAVQALKHLMREDLSRPGLLSAWANSRQELVVGDGSRLGGHKCGVEGVQIPILAAMEIRRILKAKQSEALVWTEDVRHLMMEHAAGVFMTLKPTDPFEVEWYERVMEQLTGDSVESRMSVSELKRALGQAKVTAGASVTLAQGDKALLVTTVGEDGEKTAARLRMEGTIGETQVILGIDSFIEAVDTIKAEMIKMEVCEKVVRLEDENGWEILPRKEKA